MISNFCEEQRICDAILSFHEQELQKMEIPKWMNVRCPFCHKNLPLRSIRSVSVKLNTRNLGDLALEIFCDSCSKMDVLYFRKEIEKITDFISFLTGEKEPHSKPILEEEMYGLKYNNTVERLNRGKDGIT